MTDLVPLKRVSAINAGQSPPSEHVSDAGNGLPFLQGNAEFGAMHPTARYVCDAAPKRCKAGDILLSVRAPVGALNVADQPYGIGRGLCAITPNKLVPRYLWWAMNASVAHLQSQATGSTYGAVAAEDVGGLAVLVPTLPEQHAIADYLDAETARIDGLVAARAQMLQLVVERLDGATTSVLDRSDWPVTPLKWKTRVTVGIVIRPSELYVEEGVPCLRGFNVRPGAVNATDLVFISPLSNALNAKSTLALGDVVVVRTGKAGAAAVVPEWAVGGNCVDLLIIRRSGDIDPRFLEAVLNSAVVRRQIDEGSVGALQAHFNTEDLANLRVPVPSQEEQASTLSAIDAARAQAAAMTSALTRQIDLLVERRQALISAAVTGQVAIPGVAA